MFPRSRAAATMLAQMNVRARALATNASAGPKRESTFVRVWLRPKEAWPIFAMIAGALSFVGWKLAHDASSHEVSPGLARPASGPGR